MTEWGTVLWCHSHGWWPGILFQNVCTFSSSRSPITFHTTILTVTNVPGVENQTKSKSEAERDEKIIIRNIVAAANNQTQPGHDSGAEALGSREN